MTQQLHSWVFNLKRNGNLRSCKNLCSNIQGSCIPNNPKLITTQMSFNGRMVKQTMLHACHGILLSSMRKKKDN